MAYLYDLTDTWNAAGTVFNAIKMNVTNTASAAGSKIVALQVGATDRFTVDKDGNGYFSGTLQAVGSISSPNLYIGANSGTIGMQDNTASILAYNGTGSGGITNTLRFITAASERVRIDASGNVGIGQTNPAWGRLEIASGSTNKIRLYNDTGNGNTIDFLDQSWQSQIAGSAGNILFSTGGTTERMRIDSSGNVGIGTSSVTPVFGCTVKIYNAGSGGTLEAGGSTVNARLYASEGAAVAGIGTTTNTPFQFITNDTLRATIDTSGNFGIGTSSPLSVSGYKTLTLNDASGGAVAFNVNGTIAGSIASFSNDMYYDSVDATVFRSGAAFNGAPTERMRIDTSGNLGLGVTPSAWGGSNRSAIQMPGGSAIQGSGALGLAMFSNAYNNGTNDIYIANGNAYKYVIGTGHQWFTAPSGTAGNAISFTQAMTLDASGNLLVGTTTPAYSTSGRGLIEVNGSSSAIIAIKTGDTARGYFGASSTLTELSAVGASQPLLFTTNGAERMRIDSSGNVGIGTSSPGLPLDVQSNASGLGIRIRGRAADNDGYLQFSSNNLSSSTYIGSDGSVLRFETSGLERFRISSGGVVQVQSGNELRLYRTDNATYGSLKYLTGSGGLQLNDQNTDGITFVRGGSTESMRIDGSGNLLVGTTTSSYTDSNSVVVSPGTYSGQINVQHATGSTSGNGFLVFTYATNQIGSISQNGTTGVSFNTSSDARLKENISPADDAAALIDAIQVRKFDWKADGSHQRYGMVAQELLEVAPEAVSVPADEDQMMGVDYSKLVPMMLKEIQSLRARVAQLEGN